MNKKILIILVIALICVGFWGLSLKQKSNPKPSETIQKTVNQENLEAINTNNAETKKTETPDVKKVAITKSIEKKQQTQQENVKTGNLYVNSSNNSLPLSAMSEIASLSENTQNAVNKVINSTGGVYLLKKDDNKILLIVENQKNIRHGVDFVEISTKTGQQKVTSLGYLDKMKDSNNDNWEYDKTTYKPVKHIIYGEDGDVEYIETWNYSNESPIKYEIKDGDGHVVSLKKETLDDNSNNLRVEHIVYDKDGKTKVNVSTTYEGADIKRFIYYNADKLKDSASVIGEYKDGQKVKETVYSYDFKVENTYTSDYNEEGLRSDIRVFDNQDNEIEHIISK